MKIAEIIQRTKEFYKGSDREGVAIDETQTRDRVLFGNINQDCTGVATTCFASYAVIEKAIQNHVNLIICHEALFWNHGDKTDWLTDNTVYQKKAELLTQHNIVVWRNHDYIHSGMMVDGHYVDGIFYGVMKALEWDAYRAEDGRSLLKFTVPSLSVADVATHLIRTLGLNGLRTIGDATTVINSIQIPYHILGNDNATITQIESDDVDALIALEVIDFTVSEYMRDSSQSGHPRVIFSVGHFNLEEPGMEYMIHYLPTIIGSDIPVYFIKSGDSFQYYQA